MVVSATVVVVIVVVVGVTVVEVVDATVTTVSAIAIPSVEESEFPAQPVASNTTVSSVEIAAAARVDGMVRLRVPKRQPHRTATFVPRHPISGIVVTASHRCH